MANSHRDNLHAFILRVNRDRKALQRDLLSKGHTWSETYDIMDQIIDDPWNTLSDDDWRRAFYAPKGKRISYSERNRSMRAKARVACRDACRGDYHKADTLDRPTTLWW